jgi:hypothetical protein
MSYPLARSRRARKCNRARRKIHNHHPIQVVFPATCGTGLRLIKVGQFGVEPSLFVVPLNPDLGFVLSTDRAAHADLVNGFCEPLNPRPNTRHERRIIARLIG